jgi:membrane associated rhomboid family serine protease
MFITRWVIRLILANFIMFFFSMAFPTIASAMVLVPALAISRPWTLVTYMFLHGGFGHIFFNMLGLYFFGPRLEIELGGRKFLGLYFISGLMGAALSFIFTPYVGIIGASGAVYGVLIGFAYFWPREPLYIWGLFPIEARILVAIMTGLSLYGGFTGSSGGIAHFAHLGGFAGGFLYLKWLEPKSRTQRIPAGENLAEIRKIDPQRWAKIPRESLHEVNLEELDRILGKIRTLGLASLTADEIAFLDRFSPP